MDHISNIQEIVDENRDSMPTGVAVQVMRECQEAHESFPKLWKIHYLRVKAYSKNNLVYKEKTMIVEEDPNFQARGGWLNVFANGKMSPEFLKDDMYSRIFGEDDMLYIIQKVEPYLKRARTD